MRRDVAIVSWASFETPNEPARNEVEMLLPVIQEAVDFAQSSPEPEPAELWTDVLLET